MFSIAPTVEADLIWSSPHFVWTWLVTSYLHHIIPAHCVTSSCGEISHDAPPLLQFSTWNWDAWYICSTNNHKIKILCYVTLYYTPLYYTLQYYTILCYVMLCYATLHCNIWQQAELSSNVTTPKKISNVHIM